MVGLPLVQPGSAPADQQLFLVEARNGGDALLRVLGCFAVQQAELVETMQQHSQFSIQALNALLISRNLERSADHATNIAEDVIFWLRGSDVRHKMSLAEAE